MADENFEEDIFADLYVASPTPHMNQLLIHRIATTTMILHLLPMKFHLSQKSNT
jgi:hypothetical protein